MKTTNIGIFESPYNISKLNNSNLGTYYTLALMNAVDTVKDDILRPINPDKYIHRVANIRIVHIGPYSPTLDLFVDAVNHLDFDFLDFLETTNVHYNIVTLYDLMIMRVIATRKKLRLDAFNRNMLRMLSQQRRSSASLAFTWIPPYLVSRWEQCQRRYQFKKQQDYYTTQFMRQFDIQETLFKD